MVLRVRERRLSKPTRVRNLRETSYASGFRLMPLSSRASPSRSQNPTTQRRNVYVHVHAPVTRRTDSLIPKSGSKGNHLVLVPWRMPNAGSLE